MEVNLSVPANNWNEFIEANAGPVFNRYEWGDICRSYGHRTYYITARSHDAIRGCLPLVHIKSPLFGNTLVSMPFSEHGSIVLDPSIEDRQHVIDALRNEAKRLATEKDVDYLCLRGSRYPSSPEFIRLSRYLTFEVATDQSIDSLWDSFETRFRTSVRNARKCGLTTHVVSGDSSILSRDPVDTYFKLHLRTMRDLGSPPHSKQFFRNIWQKMGIEENAMFVFVTKGNTPINAALAFPHIDTVHYWGAVSDAHNRHLDGGKLLLWRCLQWASKTGYQRVDLGRTRPDTGVYRFKSSLNGQQVYLDDLFYFPEQFVMPPDPGDSKFAPLMKIWKQLPLSVTKAIGPHLRGNIP